MGRVNRILVLAGLTWVAAGATACSDDDGNLPAATPLAHDAARAMREIDSVRLSLEVDGPVGATSIRSGDGVATRVGEFSGTASLEQAGGLVEYGVVIADGTYYLRGATGGFQQLSPLVASQLYNPASLLDPEDGLPPALDDIAGGRTEAVEEVAGVECYRVVTSIPATVLERLITIGPEETHVPATLWIGTTEPVLVRVRATVEPEDQTEATVLTLTLSDFGLPADITPPPS